MAKKGIMPTKPFPATKKNTKVPKVPAIPTVVPNQKKPNKSKI